MFKGQSEQITREEARDLFSKYGEVMEVRESEKKGYIKFVEYYDSRAAIRAIEEGNGATYKDGTMEVKYASFSKKEIERIEASRNQLKKMKMENQQRDAVKSGNEPSHMPQYPSGNERRGPVGPMPQQPYPNSYPMYPYPGMNYYPMQYPYMMPQQNQQPPSQQPQGQNPPQLQGQMPSPYMPQSSNPYAMYSYNVYQPQSAKYPPPPPRGDDRRYDDRSRSRSRSVERNRNYQIPQDGAVAAMPSGMNVARNNDDMYNNDDYPNPTN